MGGSSVMVDDMTAYLRSLDRIAGLALTRLLPGHGDEIERPSEVISWYLAHRREREQQIAAAVRDGASTVGGVVELVYEEVDPALYSLAARSVVAHLRKLAAEGVVELTGDGWDARVEALR
jgi:glyoxylase-like metal-dependent hydrolase (beta-lactamase superfamily II)